MRVLVILLFISQALLAHGNEGILIDESSNFLFKSSQAKVYWPEGNFINALQKYDRKTLAQKHVKDLNEEQKLSITLNSFSTQDQMLIYLSAVNGTIQFFTKESGIHSNTSYLLFESDTHSIKIEATVDTYVVKNTIKDLGSQPFLSVSPEHHGLLLFDIPNEIRMNLAQFERISLNMQTNQKQFGDTDLIVTQLLPDKTNHGVTPGIAQQFYNDFGISRHEDVYYAESFETKTGFIAKLKKLSGLTEHRFSGLKNFNLIDQQEIKTSKFKGQAVKAAFNPASHFGLNMDYIFSQHHNKEPSEAYFRYYLYLDTKYPISGGGKLPGFGGTYGKAGWGGRGNDGNNGWSARGAFYKSVDTKQSPWFERMPIGSYIYQVNRNKYGQALPWGDSTSALENNKWYCIEQRLKLNTPGESDGILEAWINGIKVTSIPHLNFRSVPTINIEKIWFNFYFGGTEKPTHPFDLYLDDIVIASSYIGPKNDQRN